MQDPRPPKLVLAVIALVLGGLAYFAVGFGFTFFVEVIGELDPAAGRELRFISGFFSSFCYVLGVASAALAIPLWRRRKWAWIASLVVMATYAASAFLPLGALGLWGLLDKPSRAWFGISS